MSHPHPELGPPPRLPKGALRIVPLGGLGEIGRNMTVFEYGDRLLVVDCGVLFPEETQPGVDVILPDFTWIRDRLDRIAAIVLTHGHEDHIGGLPYLLRERKDIPVVGSRLTLAFIASKLKERLNRPVIAFAAVEESGGELRGSGRSVAGFHLRDALAAIDAHAPGLIVRFGGHAMAAGLTLRVSDFARFADAFDQQARRALGDDVEHATLVSDGPLDAAEISLELAETLAIASPWGQGFAEPLFDNVFAVKHWRVMGEKHLRLELGLDGALLPLRAIYFNGFDGRPPPGAARVAYRLGVDGWGGTRRVQLYVEHLEPA